MYKSKKIYAIVLILVVSFLCVMTIRTEKMYNNKLDIYKTEMIDLVNEIELEFRNKEPNSDNLIVQYDNLHQSLLDLKKYVPNRKREEYGIMEFDFNELEKIIKEVEMWNQLDESEKFESNLTIRVIKKNCQ